MYCVALLKCGVSRSCHKLSVSLTLPLKFHTKYLTHTLKNLRALKYKSMSVFEHHHLQHTHTHRYLYTPPCYFTLISVMLSGVGVTKAAFDSFSEIMIFDLVKVPLRLYESHLYLTGATAAELRRHLSNINVIFNNWHVFFGNAESSENNGENWLSTPHHWSVPMYQQHIGIYF